MPSKTLILDPLTLRGRELLRCSDRLEGIVGEWDFRHTDLDEEHQIADMAEGPALVPPLDGSDDLVGADVIVVASDGWSSRHEHLLAHLDDRPDTLLLDLRGFDREEALRRAHSTIGRAIWIATSVIVAGFCVLVLSDFFPSVWFGVFTGIAMLMSQFAALTTLPSLFLVTGQPKMKK